jgi:hypothetical protein
LLNYVKAMMKIRDNNVWAEEWMISYIERQLNINIYTVSNQTYKLHESSKEVRDNGKINIVLWNSDNVHFETLAKRVSNDFEHTMFGRNNMDTIFSQDEIKSLVYDKYYILKETYDVMYNHVMNEKTEYCSYLENNDNILYIKQSTLVKGGVETYDKDKIRGMCQYEGEPTSFIYHSHPVSSRSYPSTEDVIKVLKSPSKYEASVIATRWGIYVIKHIRGLMTNEDEKFISNNLATIGFMENDKGYKENVYSVGISEDELKKIEEVLKKIEEGTMLDMKFYRWSVVEDFLIV